jgi:hypothetical protein
MLRQHILDCTVAVAGEDDDPFVARLRRAHRLAVDEVRYVIRVSLEQINNLCAIKAECTQ